MERKRKILVLIDWYLPGFRAGGPIQSCSNIVDHLKNDFDFSIATSDTDLGGISPYPAILSDNWNTLPNGDRVYYFSKKSLNFQEIKMLLLRESFDTIYLNSLFSKYFTIYPLLILKNNKPGRRIIVAPRGMLGPGALNIKPLKKVLFLAFSKLFGLYKNVLWHASTEMECKEIKNVFGNNAEVVTALNLPSIRTINRVKRIKEIGKFNLIFLSRISLKKNLHSAIQFLRSLNKSMEVIFDIYGSKEDALYWDICESEIRKTSSNIKVSYKGIVDHSHIQEVFKKYHFFILPTSHENYGHSIVESLSAGCPVIISDQTPWRNLESKKAGWDISLSHKEKFVEALNQAARMQQSEFDEWSENAYDFAGSILYNENVIEQNRQLFLK
ncbi:MAG: glycosyltransferase [Bacteroidetes bacterium]|nr:MAG: glycosyltransferase [Bacteroidota bacterium]